VRINPYELHVRDQDFYDVIYTGNAEKRDKWHWSAKMFGNSGSMLGTLPHAHHRLRRGALNPFFSKQSVAKLEPMIVKVVENLCRRFREAEESVEPVNLGHAYAALTMDVITEYSFAKSYGCVDAPDFMRQWPDTIDAVSQASHVNKQFGWLLPMFKMMPLRVVKAMNPNMVSLIFFQNDLKDQVQKVMDGRTDSKRSENVSIFQALLESDLPPNEKTLQRLVDEGQTVVGAGQVTTAHYLKMVSYHLIANPNILAKLKSELVEVMPDPSKIASQSQLEQLPYLRAVVLEGRRMSYGVTHRLQRISPDSDLQFQNWIIPAGTPIGMTAIWMHDNPDIFPEPRKFKPERWLQGGERMEKYLVNFSKGTRQCLGLNLAMSEIYLTLAAIFRRFDFEFFETTREDVDIAHDFFNPQARLDSKGVRVVVK
jgi:cytochrome P450